MVLQVRLSKQQLKLSLKADPLLMVHLGMLIPAGSTNAVRPASAGAAAMGFEQQIVAL